MFPVSLPIRPVAAETIGVVQCPRHVIAAHALQFRAALIDALRRFPDGVIVDLSETETLDAVAMRTLASANASSGADGGRLALVRPSPAVRALLDAAPVRPLPATYARVDAACLALHAARAA